jgi:hypothetical protein
VLINGKEVYASTRDGDNSGKKWKVVYQVESTNGFQNLMSNSSLKLRLDASSIDGNSNSSLIGDQGISKWTDLSGNQNHALQPTANRQPAYTPDGGGHSVRFDGSEGLIVSHADSLNVGDSFTYTFVYTTEATEAEAGMLVQKYSRAAAQVFVYKHNIDIDVSGVGSIYDYRAMPDGYAIANVVKRAGEKVLLYVN